MTIGTPTTRQDGPLKVTGRATYAAEFQLPDMTYAALVLSPVSKGRVRSIDTSAAEASTNLLAILTHQNMPKLKPLNPGIASSVGTIPGENRVPMQDAEITYNGQVIAAVVAASFEAAMHAAELVKVDIEEDQPAIDMQRISRGEPGGGHVDKPEKFFGRLEAQKTRGTPDTALNGSAKSVKAIYVTPHEHHNPLEPHASIAHWKGDDLTFYTGNQSTKGPQRVLGYLFDLPDEQVRVVSHFIGGGFGCKGVGAWSHDVVVAVAARVVRKPVKLAIRRQDMFTLVGHRGATEQHLGVGTDAAGKIQVFQHNTLTDANDLNGFFESAGLTTRLLYAAPNLEMTHAVAKNNIAPPIFMRAPGETPGTYALETAMDEMAAELGMDPVEFRLLNHADIDPDENKPWSSKHLKECYRRGQELIGWKDRKQQPRANRTGNHLIGFGLATATYPAHRQAAAARVRLFPDGRAIAASSGCDIGTGAYTAFRLVAADALGYPVERVHMELGDSDYPFAPVAGGSQLSASVGPAVQEACERSMREAGKLAVTQKGSPLFGRKPEELGYGGGRVFLKSKPGTGEPLAAIVRRSGQPYLETCVRKETMATAKKSEGLKQTSQPPCAVAMPASEVDQDESKYSFQSFGAQFCHVRVDEELGMVRILNWASVMDIGQVLNPKTARSQIIGGVGFGIGMALHEETIYHPENADVGRRGRPVIRNLADYHIASHADVPDIQVEFLNIPDPHISTLGARGIGEIGITGCAAAISNAIFNATGKRLRELPLTPEKILET